MTNSTSDLPPKGLNWAGLEEEADKFDDEEKTRQYRLGHALQTNDLKGLFSREQTDAEGAPPKLPTPVIRPSLSAIKKPRPIRPKGAKSSLAVPYQEPPASTFKVSIRPPAFDKPSSAQEAKQAARGLFGVVDRNAPTLSEREATKDLLKTRASDLPSTGAVAQRAVSSVIKPPISAVVEAKPTLRPEVSADTSYPEVLSRPAPPISIETDALETPSASLRPRRESDDAAIADELPTAPFVLPSPLPEGPPPTPAARIHSFAPRRAVIDVPAELNKPISIRPPDSDEPEFLLPQRKRAKSWTVPLVGLLVLVFSGTAALYSGLIKLPFEVGSLFGAAPQVQVVSRAPSLPTQESPALQVSSPTRTPTALEQIPPALVQAIENQQQPAAARQQPRGTRPEPAAKAEPTPSVAPVAQEVPPQPGAQEVAEQPAPNATASAAVATVKTPEPSVALDSKGVSDAIARAGRLLSKGEIVESEALLRAVLAKEPDEHHAMEVLIRILLKRGRGGEAIPFAKRIVEKRPRRAPYRLLYGDVLAAIGQQSSAEEQWQEALSIEPNSSAAKRRLGQ